MENKCVKPVNMLVNLMDVTSGQTPPSTLLQSTNVMDHGNTLGLVDVSQDIPAKPVEAGTKSTPEIDEDEAMEYAIIGGMFGLSAGLILGELF